MGIVIRHAEPGDFEAAQNIFEAPEVIAGTLQVPFPSAEAWRKRWPSRRSDRNSYGPSPEKGPRRLYRNGSSRRVASPGRRIGTFAGGYLSRRQLASLAAARTYGLYR